MLIIIIIIVIIIIIIIIVIVVIGIISIFSFLFSHFISKIFRITLAVPITQGFCNASIVNSKSSFSTRFSKCFVTVPNAPINTGITSTFHIFQFFAILTFNSLHNLSTFLLFSFKCECQMGIRDLSVGISFGSLYREISLDFTVLRF